jgi:hypothetical protein
MILKINSQYVSQVHEKLSSFLRNICDHALRLVGISPPEEDSDNLCTTFAFHYPNSVGMRCLEIEQFAC